MGRRPNQVILEFFERGPKLDDASNRYQHTCRACGDSFPKGRLDSLTSHLFKRCPAIGQRDRQRALLQLQHPADPDRAGLGARAATRRPQTNRSSRESAAKDAARQLPLTTRRWSALETLAEVSRQAHRSGPPESTPQTATAPALDPPDLPSPHAPDLLSPADGLLEPSHPPDSSHPSPEPTIPDDHGERSRSSRSSASLISTDLIDPSLMSASNDQSLPPIHYPARLLDPGTSSPHLPGLSLPESPRRPATTSSGGTTVDLTLPTALPTPGRPLEPEIIGRPAQDARLSDKFFHPQAGLIRTASTWPMTRPSRSATLTGLEEGQPSGVARRSSIEHAATFPRPIAMSGPKAARDRSTDRGAIHRGSKAKVRARFTASRRKEVQEVRKRGACIRCRMLKKPCSGESPCSTCRSVESARLWKQPCIRTRIVDELELYSAGLYTVLAFQAITQAKTGRQFKPYPGRAVISHYPETKVLLGLSLTEGQMMTTQAFRPYGRSDGLLLLDLEAVELPSHLAGYVQQLQPFCIEREPSAFARSTLTLLSNLAQQKKDSLLGRVLELWLTNHLLVDLEMRWAIYKETESGRSAIDEESHRMICSQLQAALEKRAGQLSRTVMNDLERRLLQRAHSGWFETFLVALCLLNCVERTTWLFQTWDQLEELRGRWPLEQEPAYYHRQGEHFAEMLQMLLKMRGLPPKTYLRGADEVVMTDGDETARGYFETVHLTRNQLAEREKAVFSPTDSRSLDLKFCSKLFGPSAG